MSDDENLALGDGLSGKVGEVLRLLRQADVKEALGAKMAERAALEREPVATDLHLHAALKDESKVAGGFPSSEELVACAAALLDGDGLHHHFPQETLEHVMRDVVLFERLHTCRGGREGGREGGKEGREGGREGGRKRREGRRERDREGEREGRREGGEVKERGESKGRK